MGVPPSGEGRVASLLRVLRRHPSGRERPTCVITPTSLPPLPSPESADVRMCNTIRHVDPAWMGEMGGDGGGRGEWGRAPCPVPLPTNPLPALPALPYPFPASPPEESLLAPPHPPPCPLPLLPRIPALGWMGLGWVGG